ncbi:MAG: SOS response-associated peptidase [Pseudomonadota bacterium]
MPGRLFLNLGGAALADAVGVPLIDGANHPPRQNIAPGQQVICWTAAGLVPMRWGIIPVGRVNARGRPVMETLINARSETVFEKTAYAGVGRAVVPVSGWYEWTGESRRKTAWRIRSKAEGLLFFAAITDVWNAPGGTQVQQMATVTCPPNADVRDIHHRMGVLLNIQDVPLWLEGDLATVKSLMVPFGDGALRVEKALDVDWEAP